MSGLVAAFTLALTAPPLQQSEPVDPTGPMTGNVVVLLADDVGVDLLGPYERYYEDHPHPAYPNTTPAIDYLGRTGLVFRNAWANPVCSPTRAQIMTGMHGYRSGIGTVVQRVLPVTTGTGLQLDAATLPLALRTAPLGGYHTAALGKWHLADASQHGPDLGPVHPLGGGTTLWFHQFAGRLHNLAGQSYNSWIKTFGTAIDPPADECAPPPASYCQALVETYATVDTADDAIHLIRSMPEPFFLYVAFKAVHTPVDEPAVTPEPASCFGIGGVTECDFTGDVPSRTRCITQWLDNEVGRILCAVEDDPQQPEQPTTIVFLGDNGTRGPATVPPFDPLHGKGSLYEGGIRVPFIVKSPYLDPELVGRDTRALVTATDLFATVLEIADAPVPPDPLGLRDSISLVPVLLGQTDEGRQYAFAENFTDNFVPTPQGTPPRGYSSTAHRRAVRDVRGMKLIQRVERDGRGGLVVEEELYDLAHDPHEVTNRIEEALAGVEPWAASYAELRAELDTNRPLRVTPLD